MPNLSQFIRKFNRFELKYLLPLRQAEEIKRDLRAYVEPDRHGDLHGSYFLTSLYYDGPDLRFYWEKLDGIKFRRKLRIRRYGNGAPLTAETPVFVEIKQRINRVTQKRRAQMSYADALRLCSQREAPEHNVQDAALVDEVLSMAWQYNLRPSSVVRYQRQAFVGGEYDPGLRVTFDTDLSYRSANLDLAESQTGDDLPLFPGDWAVMEIKVNERVPYWLTEVVAEHNLNITRVSKYCKSIELATALELQANF